MLRVMPRAMRVEYPGAIYHVMDRGDRREDVFVDDADRQDLLKTLAEACQKTSSQVHTYSLMRDHFHLVVETPNGNLVAGMRWLLSAYTIRLNHLARRGWTEADLAARQRSDPGKLAIAVRLRSETSLPVKWIAARVQIGATKGAKSLLHRLAPGQRQRKCTRMNQAYAQLEFQSTV